MDLPPPPFMPRRPFQSQCLGAWSEVDPATIVQEVTASLPRSLVALTQGAGLPVTPLHDGSGYILVLAADAPEVADALIQLAAGQVEGHDLQGVTAELAGLKGEKGKKAVARRKALRVVLREAKAAHGLAEQLGKAAADLAPPANPPAWALSLEPTIGPMLLNPPPWYW